MTRRTPEPAGAPGEVGPDRQRLDGPPARDGAPGEVAPRRQLDRPPGDRYRRAVARDPRPDLLRATLWGIVAALAVAVAWTVLRGVLGLGLGLLVVAAVAGWGMGAVVAWGAWKGAAHRGSNAQPALAAGLGLAGWLCGMFGAYLVSLATLPASTLPFEDRLAALSFPDWLVPQVGVPELLQLALIAFSASRSAR